MNHRHDPANDGTARVATRSAPPAPGFTRSPSLNEYGGDWDDATIRHLLRRTLICPTVSELSTARSLSLRELVDRLITAPETMPPPPAFVAAWLDLPTKFYDTDRADLTRAFSDDMRRWWCSLMIDETLSVRERMTLFWHNHFPCDITISRDARFNFLQNQLYRSQALGNFKTLVRAVTVDKAMLWYLDGKANKKGTELNENYARELQELFTIGVVDNDGKANYSQRDVHEAARVLTGWGFNGDGMTGTVACPPWYGHDPSDKVVYGRTITGREYGEAELDDLLDIIFDQEQTARYILRKLYRFFVYTDAPLTPAFHLDDTVETNIIAPLAAEFRANAWSIAHVLRRLFLSDHFYDPAVIGAQIKSPVDLMVGTMRAMRGETAQPTPEVSLQHLHDRAAMLGQTLLRPPGVQGWQFYRTWISSTTIPQRHAITDALLAGADVSYDVIDAQQVDGVPMTRRAIAKLDVLPFARQFAAFAGDPSVLVDEIAEHLLGFTATARLRGQLLAALLQGQPDYEWADLADDLKERRLRSMLAVLMRSANYQLM